MAKKETKNNKEKKHFFKDFKAEIKKVIWPTPKQLLNSTTAVIVMVLVVAVIVFVLDLVFDAFNKYALTELQNTVQNMSVDESTEQNENNTTENTDTNSTSEGETNTVEETETGTEENSSEENSTTSE